MTKAAGTIASLFAGLLPPSSLSSMPLSEKAYATDEKINRKVDYLLHRKNREHEEVAAVMAILVIN
jgi:hypothetical protein